MSSEGEARVSDVPERPTLTLSVTTTPAKRIPNGLWFDVLAVFKAHGLDPDPIQVVSVCNTIARRTPVDRGGRLEPDGRVEKIGPEDPESWHCTRCGRDMYSEDAKAEHDAWCKAPARVNDPLGGPVPGANGSHLPEEDHGES